VWDDVIGYKKISYDKLRYAYKLDPDGDYKTLYGQPCKLIKRWKKEDLENGLIFESDVHPEMRYLVDNYMSSEDPSNAHITMNFDIEVSTDGGLPDIHKALNTITSIAYYDSAVKEYTVHLLDPNMQMNDLTMVQRGDNVHVFRHTTEEELLGEFLTEYEGIKPTVLTGWNIDSFDIPYLYNRLKNVFDDKTAKKLSPIGIINYNKFQERYFIAGVSCLDMMKLYKNFTFGQRSSYSLDAIGKLEVKEGKIVYSGTLDKLYTEDKEKFIDYNVHDVRLVKMIDDKMKLIELAKGICHKGHVPLEDFQFSSRFLDGAILTYLKRKGKIVVPNKPVKEGDYQHNDDPKFDGAYVKDPIPGMYKWIIDYDFKSLYPSLIRTLNISPETKICKIKNWDEIQEKFSFKL
jgi:DNA polymerase elongation subunit (family B)